MNQHELDGEVEKLIDSFSVFRVLCSLERVCREKASYVAGSGLEKAWNKVADGIEKCQQRAAGL